MLHFRNKYGGLNSYDFLKSAAIISMVIDHIGLFFYPDVQILRVVGRLSYPLFAFCIGYNNKYQVGKILSLLAIIMAIIPAIFYSEAISMTGLLQASVLFSIIFVKVFMGFASKAITRKNLFQWLVILISLAPLTGILFPYGTMGMIMAICGYLCSSHKDHDAYPMFLAISLGCYAGIEASNDKFTWPLITCLFLLFIGLYTALCHFRIYPVKLPKPLSKLMLLASRHSLMIYFIHYELFYFLHFF